MIRSFLRDRHEHVVDLFASPCLYQVVETYIQLFFVKYCICTCVTNDLT